MNTENSKINEPHKFVFNLSKRLALRRSDKHDALGNLSIQYKNKLKIIATMWNDEF